MTRVSRREDGRAPQPSPGCATLSRSCGRGAAEVFAPEIFFAMRKISQAALPRRFAGWNLLGCSPHSFLRAQKPHFPKSIMSDFVLKIKTLPRRFGAFTAVDALTLSVNAGEVFGLLGSNGAGKTPRSRFLRRC